MTSRVGAPDESWTLTPEDHALAMSKHRRTRLGFAVGLLRQPRPVPAVRICS